jgi:hypothetical protein
VTALFWFVAAGSALAALATAHASVNARALVRPPATGPTVPATVAVLIPARDEEARIGRCLRAVRAQAAVPGLEILVLDDASTDGTLAEARAAGGDDGRVRVLSGDPPPPGWLGKPHACHLLAARTTAEVLVFLDADVELAPGAVAAAVALLERDGVDLVSPYPAVVARGLGQRLVQPLLQWSWLTFLPLGAMTRSRRPSLAAAGGQFLAVRAAAYRAAGGHAAVRHRVLEDVELVRAMKRAGGRIALADGSRLATCAMYDSWRALVDGYTKSLWAALPSWPAALGVGLLLVWLYVVPVLAALAAPASPVGWVGLGGYVCGVVGRVVTARASAGRALPDALGHPISVMLLVWLGARSYRHRRLGRLTWKGRSVG